MMENCWHLLGIEQTTDKAVIRQAYKEKLPSYHPENDPDGFKALREAYEYAMEYADSPESNIEFSSLKLKQKTQTPPPLSEEELKANEICQNYQALLEDPKRCYDINQWHQFVASFYDYPLTVIDIARWQLLEISYNSHYLSLSCAKIMADSLRWRQQLMSQSSDKKEFYDNFLKQIDRGDNFNYASLPTESKTIQHVILDYLGFARWIFWERNAEELDYYLSQDTVVYLPNDKTFMLQFSKWFCFAHIPNQAILDYALSTLAQNELDNQTNIELKYIAATQYTLLDDKENALHYWLELYNSGHYQETAISWLLFWCVSYAKNYLPLLIIAVNQSHCLLPNTTENHFYAIPRYSPTTIARLVKVHKEEFSPEIQNFINWALSEHWGYRQVLQMLLRDDGENSLYRLYRHAIMLRHGNETLLQEILDDHSEDSFEQFILQNLQRQAKQNLDWLSELSPVQEFKTWLYNNDETAVLPDNLNPQVENNQFVFARLWLDRFRHLPFICKVHLFNNLDYSEMEMMDWSVFFSLKGIYNLPNSPSPNTNDKNAYWQWYRYCILVIALACEFGDTTKYLQQENNTFNIPEDSPIFSLVKIIKQVNSQDEIELYNAIENNTKLINCMLMSYPHSIEFFIDAPEKINFKEIHQKIKHSWQSKLTDQKPVYLMLLYLILLDEPEQKSELYQSLNKITGDNKELKKISNQLEENWSFPFTVSKEEYHCTKEFDKIKSHAERLSHYCGLCNQDELDTLREFKDNTENDIVLRLCVALLLAKHAKNQKKLISLSLPENKPWQFWRWKGRTDVVGFLKQLFYGSLIPWLILDFFGLGGIFNSTTLSVIHWGILINAIFAIKRRLNDIYNGDRSFFIAMVIISPLILLACWLPGIDCTNRYGPPVDRNKTE